MKGEIGAPGDGISRRQFLAATGSTGVAAAAGCLTSSTPTVTKVNPAGAAAQVAGDLPTTGRPEVVGLEERNNHVTLKAVNAVHHVHPGETMNGPITLPVVWAWQADDGTPSVPGPILRITEGQEFSVTLDNTGMDMPHTFHVHGLRKTWENDGVPTTTGVTVEPGQKHTYDFTANVAGTHLYHCHYQTPRHMDMGMYGVLRVEPEGYERADKEYYMTVKEWDTRLSRQYGGEDAVYDITARQMDTFTVNGKSAPATFHPETGSPLIVDPGDTVRIHWVNGGFQAHPMHLHNHRFRVVEKDGSPIPEAMQIEQDVVNVAPAERYTVEFEADADPGIYLVHCHKVDHVRNGSSYPGGMLTAIVYTPVMDTDLFKQVMAYAGYEA
ncbi:multicopper oxidase domain-containing protein [Halogeometricum sp. S1BR25-6]|uniref:Multicopper oxidase domain-containing protein n=1 Tax=Halogeometricum salsisoli TaxID=2950536 RepID=A0ABU2GC13_9EURY|nr:multicopper oxidase domain-containing protein [Halogeometricum sp. S1BR25-6]MDS0297808.1 multicopper oxidase domain-containing protein [Halogeometricum sp. S1BR25-6]